MPDEDRAMKISELMNDYQGAVPGAAVLVMQNGDVAFSQGFGMADLEAGAPVTPKSNFRLASLTKQFTATAIEILKERGMLSYDDPITRYLPTLPSYADRITIRHLLTHSSGLMDYEDLIPDTASTQLVDSDVLKLLETTDQTLFEPGDGYSYSNTGYAFLALIVERVSGITFASFLDANVFEPLSMGDSVVHVEGISTVTDRAYGYVRENGRWVRRDQSITSAVLGDGGVYSNIEDLARWDDALHHSRAVSPETLELATSALIDTDMEGVGYGFGWRVATYRGRRQLWHTGETSGFRNAIIRFPDDRLTVIVLTNRGEARPYDVAMKISELYLD